jgi:hypothetical protein
MIGSGRVCLILLSVIITLLSIEAEAGPVILLGRSIEPVIPSGYCEVGGHPSDTEIVSRTRQNIGNSNQILALFADCKELDDFRKGRRKMLDNYGQILAQTPKGQLRVFKGISRQEFIQNLSARSDNMPEAFKKAEVRVKQYVSGYRLENLGLLATDSNGIYIGTLMTITDDSGLPRPIVGVVGMTLVKELSFSINLYQAYKVAPDLRRLLARQQTAIANFVRANN